METSKTDGQTTDSNANSETKQTKAVEVQNPDGVLNKNRELLGINKKLSGEMANIKDELANFKQDKQIGEGKKDEVIETLRKENRLLKTDLQDTKDNFNWNTVESQLKSAAIKEGCTDAEKLVKLIDDAELNALEVDSKFRVNNDDLGNFVTKAKKENPFLFSESSANINDLIPSNKLQKKEVKDTSQMTGPEIEAELLKLDKLERSK